MTTEERLPRYFGLPEHVLVEEFARIYMAGNRILGGRDPKAFAATARDYACVAVANLVASQTLEVQDRRNKPVPPAQRTEEEVRGEFLRWLIGIFPVRAGVPVSRWRVGYVASIKGNPSLQMVTGEDAERLILAEFAFMKKYDQV